MLEANRLRPYALLCLTLAAVLASSGCGRSAQEPPATPPSFAGVKALDPALEENWPETWDNAATATAYFSGFVRHAESDPGWLMVGIRGEAVYIRVDPEKSKIVYQEDSNKIASIEAEGGAEALSFRRYVRAESLTFNEKSSRMEFRQAKARPNPLFAKTAAK
jgi:hypothetical protein